MGLALARLLVADGWEVTISGRTVEKLEAAATEIGARALALDATNQQSLQDAARRVFAGHAPRLVVMNVGDYEPMPLADFSIPLFERLNRSNYLASVYLLDAVMPLMRDSGGGQILLNASAAAYRGLPRAAPYSAPKAAVVHMAESLRPELAAWNIDLRIINPGFVHSRLTAKNPFPMPFILSPEQAAQRIFRQLGKRGFDINFPRRLTWFLKLLRCLPYRAYFALIRRTVLQ